MGLAYVRTNLLFAVDGRHAAGRLPEEGVEGVEGVEEQQSTVAAALEANPLS